MEIGEAAFDFASTPRAFDCSESRPPRSVSLRHKIELPGITFARRGDSNTEWLEMSELTE